MDKQEIRWVQRLDSYRKAFERMNEAVEMISLYSIKNRETELFLDALIQRYEFTHELAWKLMKDYLEYMGISGIVGSRDAIRYALQNGLLMMIDGWIVLWIEILLLIIMIKKLQLRLQVE